MSILRRKPAEDESLAVASLASMEEMSTIDSRRFVEMVSGLRHGPSFWGDRPGYRDGRGVTVYLDNKFSYSVAAISTDSPHWMAMTLVSHHPLVRASLALNHNLLASNRKIVANLSRIDQSSIVREAANSSLEKRPMRASNIKTISPVVADLSIAYLTLLQQLYHMSAAYLAVSAQVQELTVSLRSVPRELADTVNDQLQRMKAYEKRIQETIDGLLPKFRSVLFMMRQVESASEIKDHIAQFNNSGIETVMAKLPSIMADAVGEIDRLYREADIQIGALSDMDEIDHLLAQGNNGLTH